MLYMMLCIACMQLIITLIPSLHHGLFIELILLRFTECNLCCYVIVITIIIIILCIII